MDKDDLKVKERIIDWNHVYLRGWYGPDGRAYLASWIDTEATRKNHITVVVTGPDVQEWGPPIWKAPANCRPNPFGYPVH